MRARAFVVAEAALGGLAVEHQTPEVDIGDVDVREWRVGRHFARKFVHAWVQQRTSKLGLVISCLSPSASNRW